MTGRISIDLFVTLDGVGQAPGAPDEDPEGGFRFGGWQAPVTDEVVGRAVGERLAGIDALLLGRRTYDIFAAYWPHHTEGLDGGIGRLFDRIPKYVASRSPRALEWQGSTRLGADIAAEVRALRERHRDVHVIGSIDFVQTLLAGELYDELALWVFPVVLGQGKKVFPDGAVPARLSMVAPPVVSGSGAVLLRYGPAGAPTTGDMTSEDRGA
ncbi:dihydrofolate reductase family protein [Amnibacterium sp.]|uniref:dihydrofolate reductase family protein n=1 Tax=Amnibacterium sp. TaxID=1872496 RepID=UPI0026125A8C|nr:dihydrofolate reductase family protein [Amnibacterium sp.]MCU1474884.1 bifunctional deaminase-reductase domain protein [Amnibacterium sp.]